MDYPWLQCSEKTPKIWIFIIACKNLSKYCLLCKSIISIHWWHNWITLRITWAGHSNTSWLAKIGADCQHFILSSARAALAQPGRLSKLHFCPARDHNDKQIFLQVFKYYLQIFQIFLCPPIYRAARDALWWRLKMEWVCNFLASWPRLGGYSYQVDVARVWL